MYTSFLGKQFRFC